MSEPPTNVDEPTILPAQFYATQVGPNAGARMLWIECLKDAISCVQMCPPEFVTGSRGSAINRQRRQGLIDQEWFASDEIYYGSFVWICDYLGINPDFFRGRLAVGMTLKRRSPP